MKHLPIHGTQRGLALMPVLGVIALLVLAGLAIWWLKGLSGQSTAPARQVARIALLPDTPPPPPPKEEKRPEPKEDKPLNQPQPQQVPQPTPPQPQQVREEGPTGDAAGGLSGGPVTNEGVPAAPMTGGAGNGGTGTSSDRAQERFYAQTARQLLRDAIERHFKGESSQLTADFKLWLKPDGAIQRFELRPSGDERADADLRTALDDAARDIKLPPPPPIEQPLRFRVTLRPMG